MAACKLSTTRSIVLGLLLAGLLAACSPQAPAEPGGGSQAVPETQPQPQAQPQASPQAPPPELPEDIPHLEALVSAAAGSTEDLLPLISFSSLPCTHAEGLGGPPKCLADEAEGTLVEVLPVLGPEGHHMRRSDLDTWPGIEGAQLYAAIRNPENTFSDEFFPAGEYGVAFLLPDGVNAVVFQVTQDGIVRLDYHIPPTIESILNESEILLGPIPPSE